MITIYTKNNCPYCDRAKVLLEAKGIQFQVKNIEFEPEYRTFLLDKGLRSVPQIFDGDVLLSGGFHGLATKDETFWDELRKKQA